jgi:hypothetical protein
MTTECPKKIAALEKEGQAIFDYRKALCTIDLWQI